MPPQCEPETDKHSRIATNQSHISLLLSNQSEVERFPIRQNSGTHILIRQTCQITFLCNPLYLSCPRSGFLLVITVWEHISVMPLGSVNSLHYVVKLDCEPREHQKTTARLQSVRYKQHPHNSKALWVMSCFTSAHTPPKSLRGHNVREMI